MSSAGHVLDMIKRLRQNRSLRPSNRQKFKANNRETNYARADEKTKIQFKEFTEEQVKSAIKQIRQDAKAKRRKDLIFWIFSLTIAKCY